MRKLYRNPKNAILGGVCTGISDYIKTDVTIIRVLFIIFAVIDGLGVLVYLVLWILLPVLPNNTKNTSEEEVATETTVAISHKTTEYNYLIGIVLVTAGTLLLIANFIQQFLIIEKLWPLIFVALGIGILLNNKNKEWYEC